ncbi:unnamed protein product [Linum tenue]|uniref:RNase H type-1 domain-containing protein n=1 Tax=Linum tenue TaxID=586396 RepID=A0AAV0J4G7_9ROSI|nr:unnamed protein product [Linum tenue]
MDCEAVLNGIRDADRDWTEFGLVCRSIKRILGEIGGGEIKHVYRTANAAAHIMAHVKTRWDEVEVWIDRPPMVLLDQLELDNVMASHD